jgi:hypothetical protein
VVVEGGGVVIGKALSSIRRVSWQYAIVKLALVKDAIQRLALIDVTYGVQDISSSDIYSF